MALRLQTPSQTFLLTHTTAKYLCALCTVHSAVHQVDFAHCVVYSEVLVLACIGVTLRSLPFLHHLTVTEIQRPLLLLHIISTLTIITLLNFIEIIIINFIKIIISFLSIQGLRDKADVYCSA